MGKLTLGLSLALFMSLLLHGWQTNLYLNKRDELVVERGNTKRAKEVLEQTRAVANACSDATEDLRELAGKRNEAAKGVREQANGQAKILIRHADAILARPQPVPGDECASAQVLINDWIRERASP